MADKNLWYVKKNATIRGPFPAGMITRHILLGRIVESDQLSQNQNNWKLLQDYPELIPIELKLDLSDAENVERLRIARLREDERQHGDRRDLELGELENIVKSPQPKISRSGMERRSFESKQSLRHRELKTEFRRSISTIARNYTPRITILIVFILSIIGLSITIAPQETVSTNFCQSPATPYINWSNCFLEGINLVKQDLTGANLVNGSFTGADMRSVNLQAAKLSYANLANSQMQNADLHNSIMIGTVLRNGNLTGANFSNVNLSYAVFQGADLTGANFSNANLTHVVFNDAIVNEAIFSGAILDKAIWTDNSVCAADSVGRCNKNRPLVPTKNSRSN